MSVDEIAAPACSRCGKAARWECSCCADTFCGKCRLFYRGYCPRCDEEDMAEAVKRTPDLRTAP